MAGQAFRAFRAFRVLRVKAPYRTMPTAESKTAKVSAHTALAPSPSLLKNACAMIQSTPPRTSADSAVRYGWALITSVSVPAGASHAA